MKWLPWALLVIVSAALGYVMGTQRSVQAPIAALSSVASAIPSEGEAARERVVPELAGLSELALEIRGLRADLLKVLEERDREPIGENELSDDLRRLIDVLEQRSTSPQGGGPVVIETSSYDLDIPQLIDFHSRLRSPHEETGRAYLLRSQQEILNEFGVPSDVWTRSGERTVQWTYKLEASEGDQRRFTFRFLDGVVLEIY